MGNGAGFNGEGCREQWERMHVVMGKGAVVKCAGAMVMGAGTFGKGAGGSGEACKEQW